MLVSSPKKSLPTLREMKISPKLEKVYILRSVGENMKKGEEEKWKNEQKGKIEIKSVK
jgi:hypothetical protein